MFTTLCVVCLIVLAVAAFGCVHLMTKGTLLEWLCGWEAFKAIGGLIGALLTAIVNANE